MKPRLFLLLLFLFTTPLAAQGSLPDYFSLSYPNSMAFHFKAKEFNTFMWTDSEGAETYRFKLIRPVSGTIEIPNLTPADDAYDGLACVDNGFCVLKINLSPYLSDLGTYTWDVIAVNSAGERPSNASRAFSLYKQLVKNGSFETPSAVTPAQPSRWTFARLSKDKRRCNTLSVTFSKEGQCAYLFTGSATENSLLHQKINVLYEGLDTGDNIDFRLFMQATGTPDFTVRLKLFYAGGGIVPYVIKETLTDTYMEYSRLIPLTGYLESAKIELINKSKSGQVRVDGIKLFHVPPAP